MTALTELHVAGYRTLRDLRLPVERLQVVVGPNGCGKTNLYRALLLLSRAADGTLARTLAEEGGMPSVTWAGPRKKKEPVRVAIEAQLEDYAYRLELGLTAPAPGSAFNLDPAVKEEEVWMVEHKPRLVFLERQGPTAWMRDLDGVRTSFPFALWAHEAVFPQIAEPHRFPVLATLRRTLSSWRFYHHFRSDPLAPARAPQVAVRTPVLASDGSDLAAALATIQEIGDGDGLDQSIASAFGGAELSIDGGGAQPMSVELKMPGLLRPLRATELSDGTLRYLSLVAALLTPRAPPLMVLNEPETSIHPDLMQPLAELIADAAKRGQVFVTTHSTALAAHLSRLSGATPIALEKLEGATTPRTTR